MAREHLEKRDEWQGESAARGADAEKAFDAILRPHVAAMKMIATRQPTTLREIYGAISGERSRGIAPDYEILNPITDRRIWVEIKRQRAVGNAHERACKYFMPGIVESARIIGNHPAGVIPFWIVFTNGIAQHPRYRQEISHWFKGVEKHLLLWRRVEDHEAVLEHFDTHIQPLLS